MKQREKNVYYDPKRGGREPSTNRVRDIKCGKSKDKSAAYDKKFQMVGGYLEK